MRQRSYIASLLPLLASISILGASLDIGTPRPSSSVVSNPRVGAYRGYMSRSGKPRGKYKKHGLSSAARRRSIAGVKKRRRGAK